MRISFDLDDTLFVPPDKFKTEKPLRFPLRSIFRERLRYGTVSLINRLRADGNEVWIYTTSFRTERYIRALFRCYGVRLDEIINGETHQREVQGNRAEPMPSKYPTKYRIDLHIDDDASVYKNGKAYGFKVMLVRERDDEWDKKILERVKELNAAFENINKGNDGKQ